MRSGHTPVPRRSPMVGRDELDTTAGWVRDRYGFATYIARCHRRRPRVGQARWLRRVYPGDGLAYIGKVEPDLLAEALIIQAGLV